MSTTIHQAIRDCINTAFSAEERRAYAVAAALEVIAAKASGADSTQLWDEFGHLSEYADQIQQSLQPR